MMEINNFVASNSERVNISLCDSLLPTSISVIFIFPYNRKLTGSSGEPRSILFFRLER